MKMLNGILSLVLILGVSTTTGVCFAQSDFSSPDDGAAFLVSSVPIAIQMQVGKNIFIANIPNDKGGFSTVIIQKQGNRFIGFPGIVMGNGL